MPPYYRAVGEKSPDSHRMINFGAKMVILLKGVTCPLTLRVAEDRPPTFHCDVGLDADAVRGGYRCPRVEREAWYVLQSHHGDDVLGSFEVVDFLCLFSC